jgi:hypothetical protein
MWFQMLHDWLCAILFGGNAPGWLLWLHQFFT